MYLFFLFAAGVAGAFLIMAYAALKRFNHSGPFFAAAILWFIYALYELHAAEAGADFGYDWKRPSGGGYTSFSRKNSYVRG
jgi:hypothetical protein